jgi:hypothetical protein
MFKMAVPTLIGFGHNHPCKASFRGAPREAKVVCFLLLTRLIVDHRGFYRYVLPGAVSWNSQ